MANIIGIQPVTHPLQLVGILNAAHTHVKLSLRLPQAAYYFEVSCEVLDRLIELGLVQGEYVVAPEEVE